MIAHERPRKNPTRDCVGRAAAERRHNNAPLEAAANAPTALGCIRLPVNAEASLTLTATDDYSYLLSD
jgi:hypothetical protein